MAEVPGNPATGDLAVGNGVFKQWITRTVGTYGQVLMVDDITDPDRKIVWGDDFLTAKSLISDLTLWDSTGAAANVTQRVTAPGVFSIQPSISTQQMLFGNHTASAAFMALSQDANDSKWACSTSRNLALEIPNGKNLIVRNTTSGQFDLTVGTGGHTYFKNNETNNFMYFGNGVANDSFAMWLDASSVNFGQFNGTTKKVNFHSRRNGTDSFTWNVDFGRVMSLGDTEFQCNVPGIFNAVDGSSSTLLTGLRVDRANNAGRGAAGFGSSLDWNLEVSAAGGTPDGQKQIAARWSNFWTDPDTATLDSTIRFQARNNGALTTLLDLIGGTTTVDVPVNFTHRGTNLGFYGIGPVARPAAYTQTYATATRTHAAPTATALTNSTGESPDNIVEPVSIISSKFWGFVSPVGSTGTFYWGGFYKWHSVSFTPNTGAGTNIGTANSSYAAHVAIVIGAVTSAMVLRVSGTSIDDNGTRTAADFEDVDTTGSRHDYFETSKKFIGQVNILLTGVTLAGVINAGFAKYWDFGNTDFTVVGCEATWLGGANDSGADIQLLHHTSTGWAYGAGGTPTTPTPVASMATDHSTEGDVKNSENGAWKRVNLSQAVTGSASEGIMFRVIATAVRAFEEGTLQVDVQSSPAANRNFSDLTDRVNKLIVDVANAKQVVNQVIDDHQANGLLQ